MPLESFEEDKPVRPPPIVKDMRQEQSNDPRPILTKIYGENVIHGVEAERAFETMKKTAQQKGVNLSDLPPDISKKIERKGRAAFGQMSGGASTSNVFNTFFSPFRIRPSVETPTKRQDLNQWYRAYAKYDPMVGMAIQLHSEFPLSNFEIDHEDSTVREFFNQVKEDLGLAQFIVNMAQEYYTVGEAFPFGMMDSADKPQMWERFILLDPDYVR
ncbi:MAG TPA: hypothetical protein VNX68_09860, partial [Nitrosopumilaceae archaeon]|nr:hypothetical protein [Nitrosopumilaceae archaeon]